MAYLSSNSQFLNNISSGLHLSSSINGTVPSIILSLKFYLKIGESLRTILFDSTKSSILNFSGNYFIIYSYY